MKLIKNILTFLLIVAFWVSIAIRTVSYAQNVHWAKKVVKYSSQYSKKEKSANQVLGKPNVLPIGGDAYTAWAVKKKGEKESPDEAFIKVEYEPMRVQQIAIAESFNPGAVTKVIIYGVNQEEKIVYKSFPKAVEEKARMLNIFFPVTDFPVKEVEVILQPGRVMGWNQIDAIGISDGKDTIKAKINDVPNLEWPSEAENLGENINTIYDELSPKISPDGKTLYFVRKFHPNNIGGYNDEDDIWFSTQLKSGVWANAENIGSPLNTKFSNFVQSITPDGNTLLLGNVYNEDGTDAPGVSMTHRKRRGWSFPEKQDIDEYYNLNKYANYYLSNDGKVLLMAIERKDSYGELDLYVSFRKKENKWTKPQNLGTAINTTVNDYSPFLAADGVTMFFSTAGHSGYGKEDIFITRRLDDTWKKWSEPQNLGPVVNSAESDSKYNIPASGEYAYFSSTNKSLGKNDIFRIKLPKTIKPKPVVLISGKVLNQKTNQPVEAKIIYELLPEGKEMGIARSDPTTGEYKIILPAGKNYGFLAIAPDFYSITENIDISDITEYTEITEKNLKLAPVEVGMEVRLNNIFFEFAKATLKEESFPELKRVVMFMTDNPKVEIELAGHTDNVGSDQFNLVLSKDRAQAVADYLIENYIDTKRLIVKGYGESQPIAFNTTDEGRQRNRRVMFIIMKK